jgi:NodT family efflux transporter outer membrane factor (OMF) lipoprotein
MTRFATRALALASALVATSCTLVPPYERPEVDLPAAYFRAPAETTASIADLPWWQVFDDAKLVTLIREALSDNLDLRVAAAQIVQAQAQVAAARSPIFPQISGQASASRSNQNAAFSTSSSFAAALALSWELDFWGRYRAATQSAQAQLLATEEGRNGVIVSLVSGVAQLYLTLNGLQQRLAIVRDTAATQRDSLRLVELLAEHGVQSAAEVRQAQTQLLTTENQLPAIELSIAQNEDALATLLGKPPHAFDIGTTLAADAVPPAVPPGLPSELLERRPDIAAAERRMAAANAQIGVAEAAFFPTITLNASSGSAAEQIGKLVSAASRTWAFGSTLAETIFDAGARHAVVEQNRALLDAAIADYRQTVLTGFQQVEDELAALRILADQAAAQEAAVTASREAERIIFNQYKAGTVAYTNVVIAQTAALASAENAVNIRQSRLLASVALIQALGGGWDAAQLPSRDRIEADSPLNFSPLPPTDTLPGFWDSLPKLW